MSKQKLTQEQIDNLTQKMAQIDKAIRDHEAAGITARDQRRKILQALRTTAMQIPQQQRRD
jgi:hypothetical protein